MILPKQTKDDRRNEITRIKQNIQALRSSGLFSEKEQQDFQPVYLKRLKFLEDLERKEITVNSPELVK